MSLRLLLRAKPVSTNIYNRLHWSKREEIKDHFWYLVRCELQKKKLSISFQEKVDILLIGHFEGNRGLDSTNLFSTLKVIEDAITGHLLPDDSPKYVGFTSCFSRLNRPYNYLEVIIVPHNPHRYGALDLT